MRVASLWLLGLLGCAGPGSSGTCFFVARAGIALTSLHVIEGADHVRLIDSRGRVSHVEVVARDARLDLVALRAELDAPGVLPIAGGDAVLGERVFAIRSASTGQQLTEGSVVEQSALGVDFLLGTSARTELGNSGGPLVDDRGQVVGVMTRRRNDASGAAARLSFAVKSSSARSAFDVLPAAAAPAAPDRPAAIARARRASCWIIAR